MRDGEGVKVPLSPVVVINPNTPESATPFASWDQIPVQVISGGNPAAGAQIVYTVPRGKRVRLHALSTTLATDATVADRFPEFIIRADGAVVTLSATSTVAQTASLTAYWHWVVGMDLNITAGVMGAGLHLSVGAGGVPIEVPAGGIIGSALYGGVAGDDWGAVYLVIQIADV